MADEEDEGFNDTVETISKASHLKRIAAKNAKIAALEEQVAKQSAGMAEIEARLNSMPDMGKLEKRLQAALSEKEELALHFDSFKADRASEKALLTAGITDPADMELVRWKHAQLDEKNRPDLDTWLTAGAREDRHLASLFGNGASEASGDGEAPKGTSAPAKGLPSVNGRASTPAAPAKTLTREAILAMSTEERVDPKNREMIMQVLQGA